MDLESAIKHYVKEHLAELEEVKKWYNKKLTLEKAIKEASLGQILRFGKKKMDSHQYRVGYENCELGYEELMKYKNEIIKAKSFEDLFEITEKIRIKVNRIGDLWSYDTALRIGFNMGFEPKEVYLQSGVIDGLNKVLPSNRYKGRCISLKELPKELQVLRPYQVENFLCIYARDNKKGRKGYC
jgi:hypothetical protein